MNDAMQWVFLKSMRRQSLFAFRVKLHGWQGRHKVGLAPGVNLSQNEKKCKKRVLGSSVPPETPLLTALTVGIHFLALILI